MEKHLHSSHQENMEVKDWRPWVILGLLAVVLAVALMTY